MRVLMFGWEFPPFVSGGLGVACEGLVRGLLQAGAEVILVLPRRAPAPGAPRLRILATPAAEDTPAGPAGAGRRLTLRRVASLLSPYPGTGWSGAGERPALPASPYGPDLARDVLRYAEAAGRIAQTERFDVIHAHDWMTFLAGLEARRVSGRPLAAHVHSTEADRAGPSGNPFVGDIERRGLAGADRVITVSRYTAERVAKHYGVNPSRIRVVHNAIEPRRDLARAAAGRAGPLVLFAGRLTWQKGPDYFLEAAARVAREVPRVRFAVAGSGDRLPAMERRAAALGLERNILFTGFLSPEELSRLYAKADVYVLPSASEPFGLTALEALQHGTPVIVSRHAGVSEVVRHVLRVDFGDVEDLASKILSVLAFPPLRRTLSSEGRTEVGLLSWRNAAERCLAVYEEMIEERSPGRPPRTEGPEAGRARTK